MMQESTNLSKKVEILRINEIGCRKTYNKVAQSDARIARGTKKLKNGEIAKIDITLWCE